MLKTITTKSNKEIKLSSSAAFLYIYKNQFKEDPLKLLMAMSQGDGENIFDRISGEFILNLTWSLAKCADKTIGDPIDFYLENDDFLPLEHIEEIISLAMGSLITTEKIKN